jgi:hypothetical protein
MAKCMIRGCKKETVYGKWCKDHFDSEWSKYKKKYGINE